MRPGRQSNGNGVATDEYLDALLGSTDEIQQAMLNLDRAIARLEDALAGHRKLKADHDDHTAP